MSRAALAVPAGVILGLLPLVTGCASGNPNPRELFERTCSRCHDPGRALAQDLDQGLWEALVGRMSDNAAQRFGKPIPEQEQKVIVEYLLQHAGKR